MATKGISPLGNKVLNYLNIRPIGDLDYLRSLLSSEYKNQILEVKDHSREAKKSWANSLEF